MKLPLLLAVGLTCCCQTVFAATRTVTNLNDSGAGSLRAQMAAAAAGDTINFSVTGTLPVTSGGGPVIITKNLTITGPGMNALTIENQGSREALQVNGATVTISDLRIRSTGGWAGIWNRGNLTINNTLFTGTGGVSSYTSLRLDNCVFQECKSAEGPAVDIYNEGGQFLFTNCTFDRNESTGFGKGIISILVDYGGSPNVTFTLRGCTFSRNTGGVIIDNLADTYEDFGTATSSVVLENCTVADNAAQVLANSGGGHSRATFRNCTLSNNAGSKPGITANKSGSGTTAVTLAGTILKRGGTQPNIGTIDGTFTSSGYNLCDDDGAGRLTGPGDKINTNPGLDPYGLLYHGGYTETIALVDGSAAIDQGKSFGLATDQRGSPRPVDNAQIAAPAGGDGSDIGAFETGFLPRQPGYPSLVVTTLDDHDDGYATSADTTLREAIRTANEIGAINAISFAPALTGAITLQGAITDLTISDTLTITGPGARALAVAVGGGGRIFQVTGGVVNVSGLTLRNAVSGPSSTPGAVVQGGGVFNTGDLRFTDCTFADNIVKGTNPTALGANGGAGQGGAVYNGNRLLVERCTFVRNQAQGGRGGAGLRTSTGGNGGGGEGGAIFNAAAGILTAINCTFQANSALGGAGGGAGDPGDGGQAVAGIHSAGAATITNCTVSGNTATGGTAGLVDPNAPDPGRSAEGWGIGGIQAGGGTCQLRNTLCAGNSVLSGATRAALDVRGAFTASSYNLTGSADDSTGLTGTNNLFGTDAAPLAAVLGPLQDNGGPSDTMRLLPASPAIDKGSTAVSNDQAGTRRPLDSPLHPNAQGGNGSDIGALEVEVPQPGPVFTVTNLNDHDDGVAGAIDCTLREAINACNAAAGPNTIVFATSAWGTTVLQLGTLRITDAVTITGPGARVGGVDGNDAVRILEVTAGPCTITGCTFRRGRKGGGVVTETQYAGAIYNTAALTLQECAFLNNLVLAPNAPSSSTEGGPAGGGAIANLAPGVLTLARCTFAANFAFGGTGRNGTGLGGIGTDGGNASGGAVFNAGAATLTAELCTFSGNEARAGDGGDGGSRDGNGGDAFGGAIHNEGTLTVTSATLSGNRADNGDGRVDGISQGGGIFNAAAAGVKNTVCAGNSPVSPVVSDVHGAYNSGGYNLIGNAVNGTGFSAAGDQAGTTGALLNAMLGPLADNGGATDTLMPLDGSPARDRGRAFSFTTDQRGPGFARIADSLGAANAAGGDGSDIGAAEFYPFFGTDTDGDGMSDDFERYYGFNPASAADGAQDADRDGVTNAAEDNAGTNPLSAASTLRIHFVSLQSGRLRVEFGPVSFGRRYVLQQNRTLYQGGWNPVRTVTPGAAGNGLFDFSLTESGPFFEPPVGLFQKSHFRIQAYKAQ